ncbi:SigE family RNA polymerase sigma factor [Streptomyces sp. NPDC093064]|uniref:SigE family RNA polymerase sigma factor n=1 Tax=Streptomyces sp. NPDC093064 TaxID=3366020 RepID=UPI0038054FCA
MTLEEFLSAELPGLSRFAGALTGDPHLAEDTLSDALLVVVSRWRRISATENPVAYVRRIVVNTHLSDRRKAKRRRTDPSGDAAVLDRADPDASDAVVRRDEVDRLLAGLTPRQRVAVVLRYLLDQDDQEIAQALGCSSATVRSHLSQARAALRLSAHTLTERS